MGLIEGDMVEDRLHLNYWPQKMLYHQMFYYVFMYLSLVNNPLSIHSLKYIKSKSPFNKPIVDFVRRILQSLYNDKNVYFFFDLQEHRSYKVH